MRLRIFENFEEANEFEKVNGDAISEVISSRTVRDELDKYCDKYYGDGTYVEEFNGKEIRHNITSVRYTVEDVWTDVLGNPGIWDIICHVDIQWSYDEDTDTTGTQEYFNFYYDPVTDTIVDEKDIHTMEQDLVALTDDSLDKTESVRRPRRRSMKESSDEIARKGFVSLVPDRFDGGYLVLNDGNFVCKIVAVDDEDAINQFYSFIKTDWQSAWRNGTLPRYFGESFSRRRHTIRRSK